MSQSIVFANWLGSQLWLAVPLIASISLVYGATRHERMMPILYHAWRTAKWILGFMAIVMAILTVTSWVC